MDASSPGQPDIVVIGGGPAGSTVAPLLVRRGWRVVLVEKERHPRFHIGESLLPLNLPLFERLGVAEEIAAIGMPKYGAQFVSTVHNKSIMYDFSLALDKNFPLAYQVRRAPFDKILIDNARRQGVEVHEETRATDVELAPAGQRSVVVAKSKSGEQFRWEPRLVIDATGRDTLLANKLKLKEKNPKHASSAVYGHFRGAQRLSGREEGNISVFWFDHGWFWFIPLADGTTSVGAVCWPYYLRSRKTDPTTFFLDTIKMCPPLAERLRDATLENAASATGNYSYESRRSFGEGYVLIGDSYAFIDPVFSSGVYLAMQAAFEATEAIDISLRKPEQREAALRRYDRSVRHGIKAFTWFVYRMTSPSLRDMFMDPRNVLRIEEAMMSLLAGDVFRSRTVIARLTVFKFIYYCFNIRHLTRSFAAWRRRKMQIATAPADNPAS
jgi:flavin-dependent dehydrogenase